MCARIYGNELTRLDRKDIFFFAYNEYLHHYLYMFGTNSANIEVIEGHIYYLRLNFTSHYHMNTRVAGLSHIWCPCVCDRTWCTLYRQYKDSLMCDMRMCILYVFKITVAQCLMFAHPSGLFTKPSFTYKRMSNLHQICHVIIAHNEVGIYTSR